MPMHEFGIMPEAPKSGNSYEKYEPEKYDCISVDDEDAAFLFPLLSEINTYFHSIDKPSRGLNYFGITLIPPEAAEKMLGVLPPQTEFKSLSALLLRAKNEHKFIIHFGI